MVSHDAELDAVREHPVPAVTVSDPVAAAAVTVPVVGESAYEQVAAAWVKVNILPAIVRRPIR